MSGRRRQLTAEEEIEALMWPRPTSAMDYAGPPYPRRWRIHRLSVTLQRYWRGWMRLCLPARPDDAA